jgi:hypothetical protein
LSSSCCCWRGATPWGLASFHHHSASRVFIMQPGRNPRPVVIHKDDYRPCGGEKRAGLRPPPCPQLQGCSSSALGRRASQVGASPSAWAGGPLLPPSFEGKGRSLASLRRRTLGTWVRPSVAPSAAACLAPRPGRLWCRLWRCLLPLGRSVAARPPHGRRSCRARVGHIHGFSRATSRTGRSYKTSYAVRVEAAFLDGLVLTPVVRTGAKTASCALVQPLSIGAEVAAATGGADVTASAGEAAHCRGGCLRWRDRQCHLPPDPRLFGFNGLAVTPVGGRGRGPIRSSAHLEVIAAAGEPLGAKVKGN